MKKHWLAGVAILLLTSTGAWAASDVAKDKAPPSAEATAGKHHQWTLDEARKHAHAYADKLDKMSESEWAEHEKRRDAFFDKWHNMTPEQKEAYKKEKAAKRHAHSNGDDAVKAPSPAPADPAPPSKQ